MIEQTQLDVAGGRLTNELVIAFEQVPPNAFVAIQERRTFGGHLFLTLAAPGSGKTESVPLWRWVRQAGLEYAVVVPPAWIRDDAPWIAYTVLRRLDAATFATISPEELDTVAAACATAIADRPNVVETELGGALGPFTPVEI